jgi:hypothetical protein
MEMKRSEGLFPLIVILETQHKPLSHLSFFQWSCDVHYPPCCLLLLLLLEQVSFVCADLLLYLSWLGWVGYGTAMEIQGDYDGANG